MAGMRLDGNVVVSVPVDTGGWALLRCLVQGIRSRLLSDFLIPHFKCSHYREIPAVGTGVRVVRQLPRRAGLRPYSGRATPP